VEAAKIKQKPLFSIFRFDTPTLPLTILREGTITSEQTYAVL
jgi:hypothetical protein